MQFDELEPHEIESLRRLVEAIGEQRAAGRLGVARATLARALARLRLNRGSVALLRAGLMPSSPPPPRAA